MAAWVLVPDKADEGPRIFAKAGAFVATAISFFLLEIGDKTQIATVALAARFNSVLVVVVGTTVGTRLADVPAVFVGKFASNKLPLKLIRIIAAALFAVFWQ